MLTATRTSGSFEYIIRSGRAELPGTLALPDHPCGVILFAHGSGSSRQSPRNQLVATRLRRAGLGTFLFDLLTETESATRSKRFDIPLLAERLLDATRWIRPEFGDLPVGWFGASTGAAAALVAAAQAPGEVGAIVSRGGRPDLAGEALGAVRAPTLLIVGANDTEVLELNREALTLLAGSKALQIIHGAGHLFEEGNTLDVVADYARHWFVRHLAGIGRHCAWPREGR